jgi:hypothetical protein
MSVALKHCRKCNTDKPLSDFQKRPNGIIWGPCLMCINQTRRKRRLRVIDRIKKQKREYYLRHREEILAKAHAQVVEKRPVRRAWRENNPDKIKAQKKRHYWKHRDRLLAKKKAEHRPLTEKQKFQIKAWNEANPDRIREKARLRMKKRWASDPEFRIMSVLGCRLRDALKRQRTSKKNRTLALLGCSIVSFKTFIATKFKPGMSWDNYGSYWELDHIIPCALFDLTKEEHQKVCFHFSNYQPLSGHENSSKSDRLPDGSFARWSKTKDQFLP